MKAAFDAAHQQRYSHSAPEEPAEIIAARVSIVGRAQQAGSGRPRCRAPVRRRRLRCSAGAACASIRAARSRRRCTIARVLLAGDAFDGPAIVQEDGSTTVVPAGVRVDVQPSGHLILTVHAVMAERHAGHDPITAEIIRNALIAITDEMKTNLMRTAYNPIIYEALDYTVGLFDANGDTVSIGLGPADVHPRPLRCDQSEARILRPRRHRAGRHPADQRRLHHGQPSQPHDLHAADLSRRRDRRVLFVDGALDRHRRHARRRARRTSTPKACSCRSSRSSSAACRTTS